MTIVGEGMAAPPLCRRRLCRPRRASTPRRRTGCLPTPPLPPGHTLCERNHIPTFLKHLYLPFLGSLGTIYVASPPFPSPPTCPLLPHSSPQLLSPPRAPLLTPLPSLRSSPQSSPLPSLLSLLLCLPLTPLTPLSSPHEFHPPRPGGLLGLDCSLPRVASHQLRPIHLNHVAEPQNTKNLSKKPRPPYPPPST